MSRKQLTDSIRKLRSTRPAESFSVKGLSDEYLETYRAELLARPTIANTVNKRVKELGIVEGTVAAFQELRNSVRNQVRLQAREIGLDVGPLLQINFQNLTARQLANEFKWASDSIRARDFGELSYDYRSRLLSQFKDAYDGKLLREPIFEELKNVTKVLGAEALFSDTTDSFEYDSLTMFGDVDEFDTNVVALRDLGLLR